MVDEVVAVTRGKGGAVRVELVGVSHLAPLIDLAFLGENGAAAETTTALDDLLALEVGDFFGIGGVDVGGGSGVDVLQAEFAGSRGAHGEEASGGVPDERVVVATGDSDDV